MEAFFHFFILASTCELSPTPGHTDDQCYKILWGNNKAEGQKKTPASDLNRKKSLKTTDGLPKATF